MPKKQIMYKYHNVEVTGEGLKAVFQHLTDAEEPTVQVMGRRFGAAEVLRKMDEHAFNQAFHEWTDNMIRSGDVEEF